MRRALRNADRIIVDSASTGRDLVERGVAPEVQVTAIPLAPASRFRPCVRTAGFAERFDLPEPFILTVGVLEPRKNHIALFEALRLLHQSGEKVGLVIAGRPGWRWKNPLENPANRELLPFVRILADVSDDDLVELYNRAFIFAYPSLYEGFGLPVLEAMACGTPVVTSNTSSLPEVAGNAALFADPRDPQSMAQQLKKLLSDRSLRETMRARGIEHARQFSWRRCAESTLAVYENVCDASSA
jgi:glycosyltransferase involved in cell wall biosynthesis